MNDTPSVIDQPTFELERARGVLANVEAVRNKIKHGIYVLEWLPCFCKVDVSYDKEVTTKDRYNMPHRMVICQNCGLIRANPRMTVASYKAFYNDEYRNIHLPYVQEGSKPIASFEENAMALHELQMRKGKRLIDFLHREMIGVPNTVIDFACHFGGMLSILKEQGVKNCYGVDIDKSAREIVRAKGIPAYETLDELIDMGVKADLVIMQDIIEHLNGFELMQKIAQVMAPEGKLFIWTPGLFSEFYNDKSGLFQLAHTYQFCAATLDYVMSTLGFQPIYYNEEITSLWKFGRDKDVYPIAPPTAWAEYQEDQLLDKADRKHPPFRGSCKFAKRLRYENIEANFAKGYRDLSAISQTYKGDVMIISGGPSVDGQLEIMKEMYDRGMPTICIARMYPWCIKNGLGPTFVVGMDSSSDQLKGFLTINPETIHLLASAVHPDMFNGLSHEKTFIWDNFDEPEIRKRRGEAGYTQCSVIGGGGTVTVSCLSIAFNLGFDYLHIFGSDCMYSTDSAYSHASGIAGESIQMYPEQVTIEGETYWTSPTMMIFAQNILDLLGAAYSQGILRGQKFYGECLINKMWDGKFLDEKQVEAMTGYKEGEKIPDRILGKTK